jgi:hypothetical protein
MTQLPIGFLQALIAMLHHNGATVTLHMEQAVDELRDYVAQH